MALLKGTLEVLVLKAVSWGPLHGFEIARWIEERSEGQFAIEDAALLQALHRLEERGQLEAEWGITENNRRARYYQLTTAGRAHLKQESVAVRESAIALANILTLKTPASRATR
jgi:transcriptional regulator